MLFIEYFYFLRGFFKKHVFTNMHICIRLQTKIINYKLKVQKEIIKHEKITNIMQLKKGNKLHGKNNELLKLGN